jgi:hypothetical protein
VAVVLIPPPYRGPTAGLDRVPVSGATVGECLDAVEARHPGFRAMVVDDAGRVHRFVKLFRNGDLLRGDALAEKVAADDEIEVLAAIAGG